MVNEIHKHSLGNMDINDCKGHCKWAVLNRWNVPLEWNGIVEWPHFEGNEASLGHIMCLNSIVLHTDSSQGSSAIHLLAATFTGEGSGDFRNCCAKLVVNTDTCRDSCREDLFPHWEVGGPLLKYHEQHVWLVSHATHSSTERGSGALPLAVWFC